MKTSFITTVLNEENTLEPFLRSLFAQTKMPDEIIIVDAGSTDRTSKIISNNPKIKLVKKKGNRSVGRNEAIRKATGDIILCSDAGCILDKHWVENITKPFVRNSIDIASGYYKPLAHTIFQKCLAAYTCVMTDKIDPENFLPSSRSVAFRKEAWKKVNGYPENLDTCEDLVFDKKLQRAGLKFVFAGNAIVYWEQRKNILQTFQQFFHYAKGDGKARYFRRQTPLLFLRFLIAGGLIFSYFVSRSSNILYTIFYILYIYVFWSIYKNYRYVRHPLAFLYLPLLQFTSDVAVISGVIIGLFS